MTQMTRIATTSLTALSIFASAASAQNTNSAPHQPEIRPEMRSCGQLAQRDSLAFLDKLLEQLTPVEGSDNYRTPELPQDLQAMLRCLMARTDTDM